jgi:hypothetical protein
VVLFTGGPKLVLIRALGPSLAAFGVSPVLENPALQLFSGSTQLRSNDNWQSASDSDDIIATAIPPQDSKEASILARLKPGAYTTVVTRSERYYWHRHRRNLRDGTRLTWRLTD